MKPIIKFTLLLLISGCLPEINQCRNKIIVSKHIIPDMPIFTEYYYNCENGYANSFSDSTSKYNVGDTLK